MSSSLNILTASSCIVFSFARRMLQKTSIRISAISQLVFYPRNEASYDSINTLKHRYSLHNNDKQSLLKYNPYKIPVYNSAIKNLSLVQVKNHHLLCCEHFSSKSTSSRSSSDETDANTDPLNRPIVFAMKLKKGTSNRTNRKGQKIKVAKHRTKKPARLAKDTLGVGVVTAYSTAEEYNLEHLSLDLQAQGLFREAFMPQDAQDVLHMQVFEKFGEDDEEPREIFLFREGSVVFWNVPEPLIKSVIRTITKHQTHAYEIALVTWENEQMSYTYDRVSQKHEKHRLWNVCRHFMDLLHNDSDATRIANGDTIILHENNDPETTVLEKFAFSNALSLSVKLAIWEWCLDKFVTSIEWVPDNMKAGKKLKMSKEQVLRKLGELFSLRHRINLTSDLLISPDFYWNRDDLELMFTKTCNFLSISRRTKVLNEKLNHCSELVELMRTHLNEQHSFRLEWMIIALITVEVIFEIVHYIKMYMQEKGEQSNPQHGQYQTKKAAEVHQRTGQKTVAER